MSDTVIKVENLSKQYRLGAIGSGTLYRDMQSWWARIRGKEDPNTKLGQWDEAQLEGDQRFWALKDVSFEVRQGDVLGIIGRNGAGKSTLLKILSRVTGPTSGQIKIKGRVASLLEVGTGFHAELTGRENVYLNGTILGMRKTEIDRKFDEIVEFAEIEKFIDTPVKRYSSGMYVRLAFAVAAHLDPEILIVDEVLAVGDAAFQKKCLGKMGEVGREGRTVLFVSHNMGAVANLCRRGLLIQSGKISYDGDIRNTIEEYASFVKKYTEIDLRTIPHGSRPRQYLDFINLKIFDRNHKPCSVFSMGSTIIVRITVLCKTIMKNAEIGLKFSSFNGTAIYYFSSLWEGMKQDMTLGEHIFEVTIDNIRLLPGKYLIGIWGGQDGEWSDDNVQEITFFEVIEADITGNFEKLGITNTFSRYASSGCESYHPSTWIKL